MIDYKAKNISPPKITYAVDRSGSVIKPKSITELIAYAMSQRESR